MAKRPVPVRVNEYLKKHPEAYDLSVYDVNEIRKLGDMVDIVCTAFAYGYMKGQKSKNGGVKA